MGLILSFGQHGPRGNPVLMTSAVIQTASAA